MVPKRSSGKPSTATTASFDRRGITRSLRFGATCGITRAPRRTVRGRPTAARHTIRPRRHRAARPPGHPTPDRCHRPARACSDHSSGRGPARIFFFCESDHRWFHPLQDADADEILMREIRSHRRGVASRNHPDKYFLVEPAGGARCANSTCELVAIMGCRVTQLLGELRKGREDADPIGDGLAANGLTPENLAGARDLL